MLHSGVQPASCPLSIIYEVMATFLCMILTFLWTPCLFQRHFYSMKTANIPIRKLDLDWCCKDELCFTMKKTFLFVFWANLKLMSSLFSWSPIWLNCWAFAASGSLDYKLLWLDVVRLTQTSFKHKSHALITFRCFPLFFLLLKCLI